MSLLKDRNTAKRRLESCVESFLASRDSMGKRKTKKVLKLDKKRAIKARDDLYKIERELCNINHAMNPKIEMLAKVWLIFQPEHKDEVKELFDFT